MSTLNTSIKQIAELCHKGPVVFLTGAGISTDSGIPDYRGAGTPPRTPMNIDEFMHDELFRKRFWAGASVNQANFSLIKPNGGHRSIARLEALGFSRGVMTQNVDNLHTQAGSRRIVELHGNGNRVFCAGCHAVYARATVISHFTELNPGYVESQVAARVNPDQDAEVSGFDSVIVPACEICGGILRPDIVYFGETVPRSVFESAEDLLSKASALIVAGSSLAVNTGVRFVHRAEKQGIALVVINRGPTAVDSRAEIRIEGGTSETLAALLKELS